MAEQRMTVAEAFALWKAGTPMSKLKAEHKYFRLPDGGETQYLVKAITALVGGKEAFQALRDQGAGGRSIGFNRGTGGPPAPRPPADDTGVKVITATPRKAGWDVRYLPNTLARVLVAPDGTQYVEAKAHEKADIIWRPKHWAPVRWRSLATSAAGRKEAKRARVVKKLEVHTEKVAKAKAIRRKRA